MAVGGEQIHMPPVQCQLDPFGFNAVVVYGDTSYPLVRCTPVLATSESQPMQAAHMRIAWTNEETENNNDVLTDEPRHQPQDDTGEDNHGQLNVTPHPVPETGGPPQGYAYEDLTTDGGFPAFPAVGGMGNYRPWQVDSFGLLEEEEKDKDFEEKKKKVGRKGGKKSRRRSRCGICS